MKSAPRIDRNGLHRWCAGYVAALGLAPALASMSAQAVEVAKADAAAKVSVARAVPDFEYVASRGDTLYGVAARFTSTPNNWVELKKLNAVAEPRHLAPAQLIRIPVRLLQMEGLSAKITALNGSATLQASASSAEVPLTRDAHLEAGATLKTGPDGFVTLALPDGSRIDVTPQSTAIFRSLNGYRNTNLLNLMIDLQRGRLEPQVHSLSQRASRFDIQTPSAIAGVRGTRYRVSYMPGDAETTSEVLEGRVGVNNTGAVNESAIKAGWGAALMPGQAVEVRELLPAPQLAHAQPAQETGSFAFDVQPVTGALRYRGQVASDSGFTQVLSETVSDNGHLAFAALPDGNYYMRARAVDNKAIEGKETIAPFNLTALPPPPRVPMEPKEVLQLESSELRFRWDAAPQAMGYMFQIATDQAFEKVVEQDTVAPIAQPGTTPKALPDGRYYWRVATMVNNAVGKPIQGEWSATRAFDIVQPQSAQNAVRK